MAMYQRESDEEMRQQRQRAIEDQRHLVEDLAEQLSQRSTQLQEKTIEGLLAFPAALMTRIAASTLYAVGFVTRGFEMLRRTAIETRHGGARQSQQERQRAEASRQQETPRA